MESRATLTENEQRLRSMRKVNVNNRLGENIRKIVVTYPNHNNAFIVFDQSKLLKESIKDVIESMEIASESYDDYSLAFDDSPSMKKFESHSIPKFFYITEENKSTITNGDVCLLTDSPQITAKQIIASMKSNTSLTAKLFLLSQRSFDATFAAHFGAQSGIRLVMDCITDNRCKDKNLENLLKSFLKLMEHSLYSWIDISENFINGLIRSIANCLGMESVLYCTMKIFENIVIHSTQTNHYVIENLMSVEILTKHIKGGNVDIQKAVISLINSMFMKSSLEKRKEYAEKLFKLDIRKVIHENILECIELDECLSGLLYTLQCYLFSYLELRKITPHNSKELSMSIECLRMKAFNRQIENTNCKARRESFCNYNQRLGFQEYDHPVNDLIDVDYGTLAMDSMLFFSNKHEQKYIRLILETSIENHSSLPFVRASITLTDLLCKQLSIGTSNSTCSISKLQPFFFTVRDPYEEVFSLCIQRMSRTWHEMKAVNVDFDKMVSVVENQLYLCLKQTPKNLSSFEVLLNKFTYDQIIEMWRIKLDNEESSKIHDKPVIEFRKSLESDVLKLIRKHRLRHLVKGTMFNPYKKDHKEYQFCCINEGCKAIYFGHFPNKSRPNVDELKNSVKVEDIEYFVTGKESLNYIAAKERSKLKQSNVVDFQIAVIYKYDSMSANRTSDKLSDKLEDHQDVLYLNAPSDEEFCLWSDGLHCLLESPMDSDMTKLDMESLINMEQKIQLYYATNLTIPNQSPIIPAPPTDIDELFNVPVISAV